MATHGHSSIPPARPHRGTAQQRPSTPPATEPCSSVARDLAAAWRTRGSGMEPAGPRSRRRRLHTLDCGRRWPSIPSGASWCCSGAITSSPMPWDRPTTRGNGTAASGAAFGRTPRPRPEPARRWLMTPTAAGDRFGNLILTGNVPGGAQSVPLHGVGIARDFSISANPTSIRMMVGGPNPTSAVSTTIIGAAGTVALSALTTDPGVTATFSPPSIAAGTGSTMTIAVASSLAPGYYGVRVVGDEGAVTHYVDVSLQITPVPDFSMTANPNSSTIAQGSRAAATVTTTATGPVGNVDLSASVTPAGPTAVLSPSTVVAGGVSTLTVSV